MGVIVVVRHCYQGRIDCLRDVSQFSCRIFAICFIVMFIGRPVFFFFAVVRATVGAVHRSRVVRRGRGALVFGGRIFKWSACLSVEVPLIVCGTC